MKHGKIWAACALGLAGVASVFAGYFGLQVGSAENNPEAKARHAVMVVRPYSCKDPAKTAMQATAEGVVNGKRSSIPLKLEPLSGNEGGYSIVRQWPAEGQWVIAVVASNPGYGDYKAAALVHLDGPQIHIGKVKQLNHAPASGEIEAELGLKAMATR